MKIEQCVPRTMTRETYYSPQWQKIVRPELRKGGDWLTERAMRAQRLAECTDSDGLVAMYEWGRDCDMCESSSMRRRKMSVMRWEQMERDMYESAEGPCSLYPITPEEAEEFEPEFRDRIAEAWDNGNTSPHYV